MKKVIFENREYDHINKFDCRIVDLGFKEGGSFFTVLPVSDLEYRENNPTKASVTVSYNKQYATFLIASDWGQVYTIKIPISMIKEIEAAINAAKRQKLIKENHDTLLPLQKRN